MASCAPYLAVLRVAAPAPFAGAHDRVRSQVNKIANVQLVV